MVSNIYSLPLLAISLDWQDLPVGEILHSLAVKTIRIAIALAIASILIAIAGRIIGRLRLSWLRANQSWLARGPHESEPLLLARRREVEQRSDTVAQVLRAALRFLISALALMVIASELGVNTHALLATAGLVSLTVGMASKSLVQDFVTGIILFAEGNIRQGDSITVGKVSGGVEEMSLRRVKLRGGDGTVHIVRNGAITGFSNRTFRYSCYAWDLGISYDSDVDRAIAAATAVGKEIRQDPAFAPLILDDLEVLGLDNLADYSVIIKMRIRTAPGQQFAVGREINRRLIPALAEHRVDIAMPTDTYYGNTPIEGLTRVLHRERLKVQVRRLLAEGGFLAESADAADPPESAATS